MLSSIKLAIGEHQPIKSVTFSGLSWQDMDAWIPPFWQLQLQRACSFLLLSSPPKLFYWEMRKFIKLGTNIDTNFDINKLPALLRIFHAHAGFENAKLSLIQKITAAQIKELDLLSLFEILELYNDDKENNILKVILSKLSNTLFSQYLKRINHTLQQLLAQELKDNTLRIKPILTQYHIRHLEWCQQLWRYFSSPDKKILVHNLHSLLGENCKAYVGDFFSAAEIIQHLISIDEPDFFTNFWKDNILASAAEKIDLLFAKRQLALLLKFLDLDDKYYLFNKLLSHHSLDNRLELINNYFECISIDERVCIMNLAAEEAKRDAVVRYNLELFLEKETRAEPGLQCDLADRITITCGLRTSS